MAPWGTWRVAVVAVAVVCATNSWRCAAQPSVDVGMGVGKLRPVSLGKHLLPEEYRVTDLRLHSGRDVLQAGSGIIVSSANTYDEDTGEVFVMGPEVSSDISSHWVVRQRILPPDCPSGSSGCKNFGLGQWLSSDNKWLAITDDERTTVMRLPDGCDALEAGIGEDCAYVVVHSIAEKGAAMLSDGSVILAGEGHANAYVRASDAGDDWGTAIPVVESADVPALFPFFCLLERTSATDIIAFLGSAYQRGSELGSIIIARSTDNGASWTMNSGDTVDSPNPSDREGFGFGHIAFGGESLVAGSAGRVYFFYEDGSSYTLWHTITLDEAAHAYIAMNSAGDALLIGVPPLAVRPGGGGGVYHYELSDASDSQSWQLANTFQPPDSTNYASDEFGTGVAWGTTDFIAIGQRGDSYGGVNGVGSTVISVLGESPASSSPSSDIVHPSVSTESVGDVFKWNDRHQLVSVADVTVGDAQAMIVATSNAAATVNANDQAGTLSVKVSRSGAAGPWTGSVELESDTPAADARFGITSTMCAPAGATDLLLGVGAPWEDSQDGAFYIFSAPIASEGDLDALPGSLAQRQRIPATGSNIGSATQWGWALACSVEVGDTPGTDGRGIMAVSQWNSAAGAEAGVWIYESDTDDFETATWSLARVLEATGPGGATIARFGWKLGISPLPKASGGGVLLGATARDNPDPGLHVFWSTDASTPRDLSGSWGQAFIEPVAWWFHAGLPLEPVCAAVSWSDAHGAVAAFGSHYGRLDLKDAEGGTGLAWIAAPDDPFDLSTTWRIRQTIRASDFVERGYFGATLEFSASGRVLAIGGTGTGASGQVYIFIRPDASEPQDDATSVMTTAADDDLGAWREVRKLSPLEKFQKGGVPIKMGGFGAAIAFAGETLAIAQVDTSGGDQASDARIASHVVDPAGVVFADPSDAESGMPALLRSWITAGCFDALMSSCMPIVLAPGEYPVASLRSETAFTLIGNSVGEGAGAVTLSVHAGYRGLAAVGVGGLMVDVDFEADGDDSASEVSTGGLLRLVNSADGEVSVRVLRSTLDGGRALTGGGVHIDGNIDLRLDEVSIRNCEAETAGAMYVGGRSTVTAVGCSATGNTARRSHGGAFFIAGGTMSFASAASAPVGEECVNIVDNTAALGGGGAYVGLRGELTLTGTCVTNNTAGRNGGGLVVSLGQLTASDTNFDGNEADALGGAIYVEGSSAADGVTCEIDDSVFNDNSASQGGAIAAHLASVAAESSTFSDNSASLQGGSMWLVQGNQNDVDTCEFTNDDAGRTGGCVYCESCVVGVTASTFDGCSAGDGGGGLACSGENGHATLAASTTVRNSVADDGGGLWCSDKCELTLDDATLEQNQANDNGGGVFSHDCSIAASDVTIDQNEVLNTDSRDALQGGGGAYVSSSVGGRDFAVVSLDDVTFSSNAAPRGGALVAVSDGDDADCLAVAEACANGTALPATSGVSILSSSTFTDNDATLGAGHDLLWAHRPPTLGGASVYGLTNGPGLGIQLASSGLRLSIEGDAPELVATQTAWETLTIRFEDAYGGLATPTAGTLVRLSPFGASAAAITLTGTTVATLIAPESGDGPYTATFTGIALLATPGSVVSLSFAVEPAAGVAPLRLDVNVDLCPAGWQKTAGGRRCVECDAGSASSSPTADSDACEPCAAGSYSSVKGSTACTPVAAGWVATPGSTAPTVCSAGFEPNAANSTCVACGAGRVSAEGSYRCAPCGVGTAPDSGRITCVRCPDTHVSADGVACTACADGWRPQLGQGACEKCPEGTAGTGGSCTACTVGFFAGTLGAEQCEPCPAGRYVSASGSRACDACAVGRYSTLVGATSAAECVPCADGLTTARDAASTILECKPLPGRVMLSDLGHTEPVIEECPEGTEHCDVDGALVSNLTVAPGYWRWKNWSSIVRECDHSEWCVGGVMEHGDPNSLCAAGHGGPYCSVCLDGFYKTSGECRPCRDVDPAQAGATAVFAIAVLLLVVCVWRLCKSRNSGSDDGNSEIDKAKRLGPSTNEHAPSHAAPPKAPARSVAVGAVAAAGAAVATAVHAAEEEAHDHVPGIEDFLEAEEKLETLQGGDMMDKMETAGKVVDFVGGAGTWESLIQKLKIALGTLQLTVSTHFAFSVEWPPAYNRFMSFLRVLELDAAQYVSFGCVGRNFYSDLVAMLLFPLALLLILGALAVCGPKRLRTSFMKALLFVAFATYAPVNSKVFATFGCEEFEDGSSFLSADYSIDCNADDRSQWVMFALFGVAAFTVGVPAFYLAALCSHRKAIRPSGTLLGIKEGEPGYMEAQVEVRSKNAKLAPLTALFEAYEPQYFYMEVFVLATKVLLTGVIVFVGEGTGSQIAFALGVATITLYVFAETRPFVDDRDDALNTMSQMSLMLTMLCALVIKSGIAAEGGYEEHAGTLLIAANFIILLAFLRFSLVYDFSDRWNRVREEHGAISPYKWHFWKLMWSAEAKAPSGCKCRECTVSTWGSPRNQRLGKDGEVEMVTRVPIQPDADGTFHVENQHRVALSGGAAAGAGENKAAQ